MGYNSDVPPNTTLQFVNAFMLFGITRRSSNGSYPDRTLKIIPVKYPFLARLCSDVHVLSVSR